MDCKRHFEVLRQIAQREHLNLPLNETEITQNRSILDFCIDVLFASELVEYGFDKADNVTPYGYDLEAAIDYFNRFRL